MEHLPSWVIMVILPSVMTIVTGLLLKFLPTRTWGKAFAFFLKARFGEASEEKIQSTIKQLFDGLLEGMDEEDKPNVG